MPKRPNPSRGRSLPLLALYPLLFVAVYLGHLTLLRLPYYWDEGGYYIPAALDFFRTGTLIPQSTPRCPRSCSPAPGTSPATFPAARGPSSA